MPTVVPRPGACRPRPLYRQHPKGRQAGGHAGHATDQVRAGDQPQYRQGARSRNSTKAPRARRRGDRLTARLSLLRCSDARFGSILLQKSENAGRQIPRQKTKQAAIADRCSVRLVTEVACEFITGRCGPSHVYLYKKTFATKSARLRLAAMSAPQERSLPWRANWDVRFRKDLPQMGSRFDPTRDI